jgi:hypothetical protein
MAHENGDVELVQIVRIMKPSRQASDNGDIDGKYNDVGRRIALRRALSI